jgi:hypothetical protein
LVGIVHDGTPTPRNQDSRWGENFRSRLGHSPILRTSPRRSSTDFRLIVSRCFVSTATWLGGITSFTAATALVIATTAIQRDLRPSGAMTSTTGILVRTSQDTTQAPVIYPSLDIRTP